MQRVPTLIGISGYVKGERFPLEYGVKVVVGRSREADLSLRRMAAWQRTTEDERQEDANLRMVSGTHFEIVMYNAKSIEIVNLSPNGTYLDDASITREIIDDIDTRAHLIRFGKDQVFSLEFAGAEE